MADPLLFRKDCDGWTSLHRCVFHVDVVKNLIQCGLDPMARANDGTTPLHNAALFGTLDVVKYLIKDCGCDPMVTTNTGTTLVHCAAVRKDCSDILKYLITECNCDPMSVDKWGRQTALHSAVRHSSFRKYHSLKYLLSIKCDPLAKDKLGQTPLEMASSYSEAKALIFRKFFQIETSHPVDSYVNVLLLGNSGAGKTTLGQVIINTSTGYSVLNWFRTVKEVELCTAGIIPTKLQHNQLGNIILYDVAGHSEYYTSHTAVIENMLQGSGAVFVVVVNIFEEEALIHLQQWLTVVRNEAHKALGQCHVIVVASHVDKMSDATTRTRELQEIITEKYSKDVFCVCLNCRNCGGASVNTFFNYLSSACQSIRGTRGKNLTLYCHMMYALLEEMKQNVLTLSDIMAAIGNNDHYILPSEQNEILETLLLLHSSGLICLLKKPYKAWVVVNKQILLAEVNGILFAPKAFKHHRAGIASNTGIVTVSALGELFPNYDLNMLICFFKNMELCQEIDSHFLTVTNLRCIGDSGRLLFFPALLDIPIPDEIKSQMYQFGWCLQCTQKHDFFPSRYFHVLLLHLAYKCTLSKQSSRLNRHCTFWRNGLHWFNGHGIGTLVEIVDKSQCVLVLMSSEEGYRENMVSLRRDVIGEVLRTYKESCPSLKVEEFLIDPEDLAYPMKKPTKRTVYNVQDIISCIMERRTFTVAITSTRQIELKRLLTDESLEPKDCSILSLVGGRDLKELTDITPCAASNTTVSDVNQLGEAAMFAITAKKDELIEVLSISEPVFRDVVAACEAKAVINETEARDLLDTMSRQTLQARAGQLTATVQSLVKYCPDKLDVFLSILQEKGNRPIQEVAKKIK